jgi:septal ring factor EnvC (AmiA/AmiB activator)
LIGPKLRYTFAMLRLLCALLGLLWLGPVSAVQSTASSKAAKELESVKAQIQQLSRDLSASSKQRDQLSGELRAAETASAAARADLSALGSEQQKLSQKRSVMARQREAEQATLTTERAALASQLRVAYMVGSTEPLQMLIGQRDPLNSARLLVYYGYFGRARAEQLAGIGARIARIDSIDRDLQAAETRLAAIKTEQQQRLAGLEQQRAARAQVLERLQREAQSHTQALARLKTQQAELEQLLRELSRVVRSAPLPDNHTAFARLQGKLNWPVAGNLVAEYGSQRAAGIRWDGVVVATERGAPVHAVASGRVDFADWFSGLGLLIIINHGDGYLSIYGYNDELRRAVGDTVNAGDLVATAGDSGGRSRPELYFQLRHGVAPINPMPFFSSRRP